MASKAVKSINSTYKSRHARKRVPIQPPGEPSGKHLGGFKGMKGDEACRCGRCGSQAKDD